MMWGRRRTGSVITLSGLVILYCFSIAPVAMALLGSLESRFPPIPVEQLPDSAAIVVLGGGILNPHSPRTEVEFDDKGDRLHFAAKLYKAGKAPIVVISGGNVFTQPGMQSNAAYSKQLLVDWGLAAADIRLEETSRNTYENAANTARILDPAVGQVILVTSAFHMRRAHALFTAQGFDVVAASTDIHVTVNSDPGILNWLPNAYMLEFSSRAIKEYVGHWVYRWRGWL